MARWIEQLRVFTHGSGNARALNGVLHTPLLVAIAPQDDRGVVAVAAYHILQQSQMLRIDARQSVFVDDQYTLAVADVEQGGRHRVVRCTVGIATQFL